MRNLRTEEEIIASWKGDIDQPVVSICCITYNHEHYIEDALEGFLTQETDFPFEILIHDDASTDRTADIIREYEAKYPRLIKPIYQTENQYSKGLKMNTTFNFPRAKGEYIALCEGDDYWLSPFKLKKQKEFMENNKNFSFCFHPVKEIDETVKYTVYNAYTPISKSVVNGKDVILNHFIPTLSLFFRKNLIINYLKYFNNEKIISSDILLEIILIFQGYGYNFKEKIGVYRHHDGGITKSKSDQNKVFRDMENYKNLYETLRRIAPSKYRKHIHVISILKVEYPLIRFNLAKHKYLECVKLFFTSIFKCPAWPYALLKRKINNGYL